MLLFEYHSDEKTGMLKPGMTMEETTKVLKKVGIFFAKKGNIKEIEIISEALES